LCRFSDAGNQRGINGGGSLGLPFQIFGTTSTAPANDPTPYSKALRAIEREGLLAAQALPVTGSDLIAFRMARLLERLRHQHSALTKHADPRAELAIW
jgi:hypothetical protein